MKTRTPLDKVMRLLVASLLVGCGGSAGGTLASGRTVMTQSDSIYLSSSFSQDTATINTAGKKIVVSPTQVLLNDQMVATINTNAQKIDVTVKRGTVTLVADGQTIMKDVK